MGRRCYKDCWLQLATDYFKEKISEEDGGLEPDGEVGRVNEIYEYNTEDCTRQTRHRRQDTEESTIFIIE